MLTTPEEIFASCVESVEEANVSSLKAVNLDELLKYQSKPREYLLFPLLSTQSLSLLFAGRGLGKTLVALSIGHAVASGGHFLKWSSPVPRKVLYVDGEMSMVSMQERLTAIMRESKSVADAVNFMLLTPDLQNGNMPDISTVQGQQLLEPFIDQADLVIIDNISTLVRTGKENEAEGWQPVQDWAIGLRRLGKSVLFIHHAGKSGEQRGTSRREDVMDLVMELRRPKNYKSSEGARFEIHFTKARHISGNDVSSFEARFNNGSWIFSDPNEQEIQKILELRQKGLTLREIAEATKISKSKIGRIIQT